MVCLLAGLAVISCTDLPVSDSSLKRTEYVMGTMLSISVGGRSPADLDRALDSAFAVVHDLDSKLSNYDSASELSRINREAPGEVSVSPETFEFLELTLAAAHESSGALNPAIGPVIKLWGFYGDDMKVPDANDLDFALSLVDYSSIVLDSATRTVRLSEGMLLDPGATGKGYALNLADKVLRQMEIPTVFFDFGGQFYRRGADTVDLAIRHPRSDSVVASLIRMATGSVATSGDYERYFEQDGVRYAHIVDPRTGRPVPDRVSVTVFAEDPFVADYLSTALFVLGSESDLLNLYPGSGALFASWQDDSLVFLARGSWSDLEGP